MSVAARFYISEITTFAYDPSQARIKLMAACRGEENKAWATATPSGSIEMHVNNPDAVAWFRECMDERQDVALTFEKRSAKDV